MKLSFFTKKFRNSSSSSLSAPSQENAETTKTRENYESVETQENAETTKTHENYETEKVRKSAEINEKLEIGPNMELVENTTHLSSSGLKSGKTSKHILDRVLSNLRVTKDSETVKLHIRAEIIDLHIPRKGEHKV